jgi:hypothetical protein
MDIELQKGLNYVEYDLSIMESKLKEYNQKLNEKRKDDEKPIKVKKADNGKVYLYRGKYSVKVSKETESSRTKLELK